MTRGWWAPLAAGAVMAALVQAGWLVSLDDWQTRLMTRSVTRPPVIVAIGDRTLEELGPWPIARRHYGELLTRLHAHGAKVVAFDFLFDRPAPDDAAFATALKATGAGILAIFLQPVTRMDAEMQVRHSVDVKLPSPALAAACRGMGFVNVTGPGEDTGVIRECLLTHGSLESLALATARAAGYALPVERPRRAIRYAGSSAAGVFPVFEMADVLGNRAAPGDLSGRVVLVGAHAASLGDLKDTPIGVIPGVEVNANVVAGLLEAGFLERLPGAAAAGPIFGVLGALALVSAHAPLLAMLWIACVLLSAAVLTWKSILCGQVAAAAVVPLLTLLPRREQLAEPDAVRGALDRGDQEAARRLTARLGEGPEADAARIEALLAEGERDAALRLLGQVERDALETDSLYRLGCAFEAAGMAEQARDFFGRAQRRDVGYLDTGRRFLAADRKLLEQATVLDAGGMRRSLGAVFTDVEPLGSGASGLLFRCREPETGEELAVKALDPRLLASGEALARFRREVEALSALSHPGIVRLRGATLGKLCYYKMELVRGESLAARLASGWRASEEEARAILEQAAGALQHAHEAGVLHRDLKPSNVMLEPGGRVVIVDFGVARLEGAERLTRDGTFVGTLAWAAPEQLRGEPVDERADVYSLGALVKELGQWESWGLAPLLERMTAQDLEERPDGMSEVLAALAMGA